MINYCLKVKNKTGIIPFLTSNNCSVIPEKIDVKSIPGLSMKKVLATGESKS
jgi:hypothetical protein